MDANKWFNTPLLAVMLWATSSVFLTATAEEGVTDKAIVLGGVMDLEGRTRALGGGMKTGIEAAIKGQSVDGKDIVFKTLNDSYTPEKTIEGTNTLIKEGVFLFAGNMGTPTAKVSLPLLAEKKIPAVGFYTGAEFLRKTEGDVINFRASYAQETKNVVKEALKRGVPANAICTYAQNDGFGMEGVKGVREAIAEAPDTAAIVATFDKVLEMEGENPPRNNIGPIGVYTRNTFTAREGYDSLKNWEKQQNTQCRVVVTVAVYEPAARFIAYSQSKGEPWAYSAISATSAEDFLNILTSFHSTNANIIMTQVTPASDSDLPIVQDAHNALGANYGYVTQEGYIVGRLLLYGLKKLEEGNKPITRSNFIQTIIGQQFDLGGLNMDFTNDNQGSDLIAMTVLNNGKWAPMRDSNWTTWLKQ